MSDQQPGIPGPTFDPGTSGPGFPGASEAVPATTTAGVPGGAGGSGGTTRGTKLAAMGLGGVLALGLVGGVGYVSYQKLLGGGGPQPESAIPASAIAFAKIDLDPSGGQKISALRFAAKFKDVPREYTKDDTDLKKAAFDALKKNGLDVDYDADIKPWLGDRMGVAALPPVSGSDEPRVLVALQTTDTDKAKSSLDKLGKEQTDGNFACDISGNFAVCSDSADTVKDAIAETAKGSLQDSKNYSADVDALGKDGFLQAWYDGDAIKSTFGELLKSSGGEQAVTSLDSFTGRGIATVRFDGSTLEVAAKTIGQKNLALTAKGTGVQDLPKGTLAAVGVAGAGKAFTDNWPELKKQIDTLQQFGSSASESYGDSDSDLFGEQEDLSPFGTSAGDSTDWLAQLQSQYGVKLPDDVSTLLGDRFVVAFGGGNTESPDDLKVGLLTSASRSDLQAIIDRVTAATGEDAGPLVLKEAHGGTAVAFNDGYAGQLASDSGLGDSDAFKDAVPNADSAQFVGFVDIGGLVNAYGSDLSSDEKANLAPLGALGVTASSDGSTADFLLRLTTK